MIFSMLNQDREKNDVQPLCAVFGRCGGCQYQDISYESELTLKQKYLEGLFLKAGLVLGEKLNAIVPSPAQYYYRSRLDMKFLKIRDGRTFMGFSPADGKWMVEVDRCPIAMQAISNFLPQLKQQAVLRLPAKYRNANLVVKTSDDGRVVWGGIGRRSLKLLPEDFLWTIVDGKKIFYSLDTFFQANLSILPAVMKEIRHLGLWDDRTIFYDLYGGVGLFGICLADTVKKVVLIEENVHSVKMAQYNKSCNGLVDFEIVLGRVEEVYPPYLQKFQSNERQVVMIDPPRQGLASLVAQTMALAKGVEALLYLSCDPNSLLRDLKIFMDANWKISKVIPFDFFPRTRHLETLVVLEP